MIYFHIGSYKTGTSSVQGYLSSHQKELREKGVSVLRPPKEAGLFKVYRSFWPNTTDNEIFNYFRAQIENNPAEKILYCNEYLFEGSVAPGIRNRLLAGIDRPVKIICYIRRPDKYVESLYKQMVKNGKIGPDPEIILRDYRQEKVSYIESLASYADTFGDENVVVRAYERDRLITGDAVADFMHQCGITDFSKEQDEIAGRNPSLSVGLSEAVGRIARLLPINHTPVLDALVRNGSKESYQSGDVFRKARAKEILADFEDEMREVSRRFFKGEWPIFNEDDLVEDADNRCPSVEDILKLEKIANEEVMAALGNHLRNQYRRRDHQA